MIITAGKAKVLAAKGRKKKEKEWSKSYRKIYRLVLREIKEACKKGRVFVRVDLLEDPYTECYTATGKLYDLLKFDLLELGYEVDSIVESNQWIKIKWEETTEK